MIVLHWLSGFRCSPCWRSAGSWCMRNTRPRRASIYISCTSRWALLRWHCLWCAGSYERDYRARIRADGRVGATFGERSASRPVPALVDLDLVGLARRLICDRGRAQPLLRFFRHSQHPRRQCRAIRVRAIAAFNVGLGSCCAHISACLRGPETPFRRSRSCFGPYVAVLSQRPVTSPGFLIVRTPVESYERPWSQRRSATNDQTPSTRPNGHAPSKKP